MNLLGIDYGKSHLGLALATGPLAEPLGTVENNSMALDKIMLITRDNGVEKIVVGIPGGWLDEEIKKFSHDLEITCGVQVVTTDETMSTIDAQNSLKHKKIRSRSEKEHAAAAAIILQGYLDR